MFNSFYFDNYELISTEPEPAPSEPTKGEDIARPQAKGVSGMKTFDYVVGASEVFGNSVKFELIIEADLGVEDLVCSINQFTAEELEERNIKEVYNFFKRLADDAKYVREHWTWEKGADCGAILTDYSDLLESKIWKEDIESIPDRYKDLWVRGVSEFVPVFEELPAHRITKVSFRAIIAETEERKDN